MVTEVLQVTAHGGAAAPVVERELHDAQLGVLVEAADAVITLTAGAAAEIATRWGREALVVPHPHVVEEPRLSVPRTPHRGYLIGVHAKSLRAGMDPLPVIEEIVATLPEMPGARLRVDGRKVLVGPDGAWATDIELEEGMNQIEVEATDSLGTDQTERSGPIRVDLTPPGLVGSSFGSRGAPGAGRP